MYRLIFSLSLLLFLSSCYQENKLLITTPDNKFDEDMMVKVLTDIQIAQGVLNYNLKNRIRNDNYKEAFYNQVFLKYDITAHDFKQNMDYYNSQPEIMQGIFERVLENLNKIQGEVENEIKEESKADSIAKSQ